jgi:hypothetical protein
MPQSPELPIAAFPIAESPVNAPAEPRRPNLKGDLDEVLEFLPCFRGAVRGYERSQVDSYVSWAERELRAARRAADEMAARFAAGAVELDRLRQEVARSAAGREARQVSERVAQLLELAAEEAAEIKAAGAAEADGLVAAARTYSAAMLRRARAAEDDASAQTQRAAVTCAQADELLTAAQAEAEDLRAATVREQERVAAAAAQERRRLDQEAAMHRAAAEERARRRRDQEAAAAAEVVAAARREVEQLHRRRDRAEEHLQLLTARISEALRTLGVPLPAEPPHPDVRPNTVAVQPRERTPAG